MYGVAARRTMVDAQRIAPEPAHLPITQQRGSIRREPRKMHLALFILIPVLPHVRPPRRPPGPKQHNRFFGNPPVPLLPCFDACGAKLVVCILATLGADID